MGLKGLTFQYGEQLSRQLACTMVMAPTEGYQKALETTAGPLSPTAEDRGGEGH